MIVQDHISDIRYQAYDRIQDHLILIKVFSPIDKSDISECHADNYCTNDTGRTIAYRKQGNDISSDCSEYHTYPGYGLTMYLAPQALCYMLGDIGQRVFL